MDNLTVARALHVVALVHWIGGVSMVTLVLLPGIAHEVAPSERLRLFEAVESRFARQARVSTLVAGLSGFWMVNRLSAWDRFSDLRFWWLHAMVVVWAAFTVMLFVAEPFFLHRWFRERAAHRPDGTFRLVLRLHIMLLTISAITVVAGVLGAHGALY
jgi:hypothetical protein